MVRVQIEIPAEFELLSLQEAVKAARKAYNSKIREETTPERDALKLARAERCAVEVWASKMNNKLEKVLYASAYLQEIGRPNEAVFAVYDGTELILELTATKETALEVHANALKQLSEYKAKSGKLAFKQLFSRALEEKAKSMKVSVERA